MHTRDETEYEFMNEQMCSKQIQITDNRVLNRYKQEMRLFIYCFW